MNLTKSKVRKMSKRAVVETGLEAMRAGAKRTRPHKGDYFDIDVYKGKAVAACAMGAMYVGLTGTTDADTVQAASQWTPEGSPLTTLENRLGAIYEDHYEIPLVDDNDDLSRGTVIRKLANIQRKLNG